MRSYKKASLAIIEYLNSKYMQDGYKLRADNYNPDGKTRIRLDIIDTNRHTIEFSMTERVFGWNNFIDCVKVLEYYFMLREQGNKFFK